jgi:hypothetical protein
VDSSSGASVWPTDRPPGAVSATVVEPDIAAEPVDPSSVAASSAEGCTARSRHPLDASARQKPKRGPARHARVRPVDVAPDMLSIVRALTPLECAFEDDRGHRTPSFSPVCELELRCRWRCWPG